MSDTQSGAALRDDEEGKGLLDLLVPLVSHRRLIIGGSLLAGLIAAGVTFIIPPTFTARASFLTPQQQGSAAASALANLGALAGLAGASAGVKTPGDQYVALMQSRTVADRIIDKFHLMQVYEAKYRESARKALEKNMRVTLGKKDGLISVEVDDEDPQRAAQMTNRLIDELRALTDTLALTEAQQRRVFFETQLKQTRDNLAKAQQALQASGINVGALRAEPKAAAEGYARLQAELTAAEVRLQTLRRSLADGAPEVQQQHAVAAALRTKLAQLEVPREANADADYIGKYREFKYQETLFELFSRQYESARLDESRDGALIQIVDPAQPPERRSKPKRALTALGTTAATFVLLAIFVLLRASWRESMASEENAAKVQRLRDALGKRSQAPTSS